MVGTKQLIPTELQISPPLEIGNNLIDPHDIRYTESNSVQVRQLGAIAHRFKWRDHLLDPDRMDKQFIAFCQQKSFPVEADTLLTIVVDSFSLADTVYDLFGGRDCPLPYHDIVHAKLTGITAAKLFLGGLISHPDIFNSLLETNQLQSAIQIFTIVSTLHEVDDWLALDGVSDDSRRTTAKSVIVQHLQEHKLSSLDFDRILVLDDFAEKPQESLQAAMQLTSNRSFLSQTYPDTQPAIFDRQLELFKIAQESIQAADFLQIANPSYYRQVRINDGKQQYYCNLSIIALCWEMVNFRPQAIVSEWLNSQGNIDTAKLILDSFFINQVAMPRILPSLDYLKIFDKDEYHRAIKSVRMLAEINKIDLTEQPGFKF